jgi:hypothetical protein
VAELDVADDVVERLEQPLRLAVTLDLAWTLAGRSPGGRARRTATGRRGVPGLAVRRDRGDTDRAVLVGDVLGLADDRGPALRAWAMHLSTSGTSSAMSTTPSPCRRWWSASGLSGSTAPLTTNRIEPDLSTNDLWSRLPFSGPE